MRGRFSPCQNFIFFRRFPVNKRGISSQIEKFDWSQGCGILGWFFGLGTRDNWMSRNADEQQSEANQALVDQFVEIAGVDRDRARFYLETAGFDLAVSICFYFHFFGFYFFWEAEG